MASLIVPSMDEEPWPTLGPQLCDFIEDRWVYGPGPLEGEPYKIEPEFRGWLYRAYEVFPQGHPRGGWRRFKRGVMCVRKGTAKTEKGAIVALCEFHPEAPVRCDGFDAWGRPVGRPVKSPYIPMMAYSKEQTEDLAFAVAKKILEESNETGLFDIQSETIILLSARGTKAGEMKAMSGSPNARDGARTTHQNFDETHRLYEPMHVAAHTTMLANMMKRRDADPWTMEQTTMHQKGQNSVQEAVRKYALQIAGGQHKDPRLFYFERKATSVLTKDSTREEVRNYILEASGPAAEWSADIEGLVDSWFEPTTDRDYFRRVWGNEEVAGSGKAFDAVKFATLVAENVYDAKKDLFVLGFDGSRNRDSTALVATNVVTNHQFIVGLWERPLNIPYDAEWNVDATLVTNKLKAFMKAHHVWRVYCDPHHWGPTIDQWTGIWTDKVIISWDTTKWKNMSYACRNYGEAIKLGSISFTDNEMGSFVQHISNAVKRELQWDDEDTGEPLWVITKESKGSVNKIDVAMAAILSYEARNDAIAAQATIPQATGQGWAF